MKSESTTHTVSKTLSLYGGRRTRGKLDTLREPGCAVDGRRGGPTDDELAERKPAAPTH